MSSKCTSSSGGSQQEGTPRGRHSKRRGRADRPSRRSSPAKQALKETREISEALSPASAVRSDNLVSTKI
eukprot:5633126-Karenia_brevis.AAC.1